MTRLAYASPWRLLFTLYLAPLLAGCGTQKAPTGQACASDGDCLGGLCLLGAFADGYCSQDCAAAPCTEGQSCRDAEGWSACLMECADAAGCRAGYMCFRGVCVPACASDGECGTGFGCTDGQCAMLPGLQRGLPCAVDVECASRLCDPNTRTCQDGCASDLDCLDLAMRPDPSQTCWVNPVDSRGFGQTDSVRPICINRRGGVTTGAPCRDDSACDRGSCQLGVCTVLCRASGECPTAPPMSCQDMNAQTQSGAPPIRACMFRGGEHSFDLGGRPGGPVSVPSGAQGFSAFLAAFRYDTRYVTGIDYMVDGGGTSIYTPPTTLDEFYALPLRYLPSEGSSMVLVPLSPATRIVPGAYDFVGFSVNQVGQTGAFTTRVRYKFGESAPSAGRIDLHVLLTDLSGGCGSFDQSARAAFESQLRAIFAGASLSVPNIVYRNVTAASEITVQRGASSPELDMLLQQATTGDPPDVLEMVMVKRINSMGSPSGFEILGIAGGIPASVGVPGTPHSGAAVSLSSLCIAGGGAAGGRSLAVTAAHELGHTMGLFHNIEQDGRNSPLGDDRADGVANLMYWAEDGSTTSTRLSPNQKMVLLANPPVKP